MVVLGEGDRFYVIVIQLCRHFCLMIILCSVNLTEFVVLPYQMC